MLRGFDESELLELVEGELDAPRAGALRVRLAEDAKAQAFVERLMADRAALRALPEPPLPMDFMAQSEQALARPMLMEPVESAVARPGHFRRQQQRLRWRVRWPRLAAAAVLLMAVGAGAWWGAARLWPSGGNAGSFVAANQPVHEAIRTDAVASADVEDQLRGTIHHAPPREIPEKTLAALQTGSHETTPSRPAVAPESMRIVDAGFVLVVSAADVSSTETTIGESLVSCSQHAALVRNFSIDEARRLESEWRLANAGGSPMAGGPQALADSRSTAANDANNSIAELAAHVRQQLSSQPRLHRGSGGASVETPSGTIAGEDVFSPTLEQQLEWSGKGATHTIVVPVSVLGSLLQELAMSDSQSTMLCLLPSAGIAESDEPTSNAVAAIQAWLTDGPQVRAAMGKVLAEDGTALVRLPVVIDVQSRAKAERP